MNLKTVLRKLLTLYDDLAYVCQPEDAKAHILAIEAEADRWEQMYKDTQKIENLTRNEREKYREALEWYAEKGGALSCGCDQGPGEHAYTVALEDLIADCGQKARSVL
jgi:hypothetical protein